MLGASLIGRVVLLLKDLLNDHLRAESGIGPSESQEDRVVLPDGDRIDEGPFRINAITAVLVNLEEESTLRNADLFHGLNAQGETATVSPEIRLNLYLLFVSRFKQYDEGLHHLSAVIRFFQTHRLLDRRNAPALDDSVERLVIELVTLPFSEQNEIWNALRTTYHPSVLYRIRLIAFRDEDAPAATKASEVAIEISQ